MQLASPLSRRSMIVMVIIAIASVLIVLTAMASTAEAKSRNTSSGQTPVPQKQYKIYIVKRGDTLKKIAKRNGVTVKQLVRVNKIKNRNRIRIGQRLRIPVQSQATVTPTLLPDLKDYAWTDPSVAIEVLSPVDGGAYHSPIELIGFSNTFEGVVHIRLSEASNGTLLGECFSTGGGVEHEFFDTYLRFETFSAEPVPAVLEFFEIDNATGDEINKVSRNLLLLPGQRVLDVHKPEIGEVICNLFDVSGYSFTFEGHVDLQLQDRDGAVIDEGFATGNGVLYDLFSGELNPGGDVIRPALASAFESSGRDGTHIDETRIPVALIPGCIPPPTNGH